MRLKHFLYLTALFCALAEIGMALYAMHWGDVIKDIAYADKTQPDNELIVVKSLNYALPVGIVCLALLLYIWRADSVGGFSLLVAVVLHFIGFDLNVRAVKKVYGDKTDLSEVAWWAPKEKNPPAGRTAPAVYDGSTS
jgi:hypothetical protein